MTPETFFNIHAPKESTILIYKKEIIDLMQKFAEETFNLPRICLICHKNLTNYCQDCITDLTTNP